MTTARPRRCLLPVPFILCAVMTAALGSGEAAEKPETVRVSGVVRLVGSGPMVELLISNEDREWQIDRQDRDRLWDLQQQTVTVEGEEWTEELTFANGRPAGERLHLRNITIIEPEQ